MKSKPPPLPKDVTLFGRTTFRGEAKEFGIRTIDRRKHVYLIGKTGMGKTTMLQNMIIGDLQAGNGLAIVDPHGDVAEDILDFIPNERVNDVLYFNPGDMDYPIGFNVLEKVNPEQKYLIASGLVGVFKKLYAESWGPRLEYILRNTLLALLDFPDATLLGVLRMFADNAYRQAVVEKIEDPVVKSFWLDEFANYNDKFRSEAVAPIQNKVGQFLSSAIIRNILGQTKSTFDLREQMDNGKIIIMSLSKGRIGEDNATLLGAMMITKVQLAAMSRANVPEDERRDFYLYVDEFQNFATESFATILSEARKYRLNLTMAHQYIEQMSEEVRYAVFGNVGTIVCFRIGAGDAEVLEPEFDPSFLMADLVNLPAHNIYLKLMIDGLTSPGFSASTLPRLDQYRTDNRAKVVKVSRERYGRPREEVEEKIKRWAGRSFDPFGAPPVSPASNTRPRSSGPASTRGPVGSPPTAGAAAPGAPTPVVDTRPQYNAVCHVCNKVINVPFKPDPMRPVYCKDCLPEVQRERDRLKQMGLVAVAPSQLPGAAPTAPVGPTGTPVTPPANPPAPYPVQPKTRPAPGRTSSAPQSVGPATVPTPKPVSLREALAPVKEKLSKGQAPRSAPKPPPVRSGKPRAQASPKRGQLREGESVTF